MTLPFSRAAFGVAHWKPQTPRLFRTNLVHLAQNRSCSGTTHPIGLPSSGYSEVAHLLTPFEPVASCPLLRPQPKLWSSTGIRSFHRSLSTETTTSLPQPTSEEIRIPAVVRYNEKLLQAKDAGKPDEMWYHYQKAKREGIPFNGHSYAILLSGLCQLRQPGDLVTRIINVYNEAQDKGFTQSLFTHTDIIRALCQRDQRIAEELQNLSRKTRMAPEVRELQQQRLEAERNFEVAFSIYDFAKDQR
ncbi:hypothetical protein BJ085DRAFT_31437, partial [Dimargaris cristalligena]